MEPIISRILDSYFTECTIESGKRVLYFEDGEPYRFYQRREPFVRADKGNVLLGNNRKCGYLQCIKRKQVSGPAVFSQEIHSCIDDEGSDVDNDKPVGAVSNKPVSDADVSKKYCIIRAPDAR